MHFLLRRRIESTSVLCGTALCVQQRSSVQLPSWQRSPNALDFHTRSALPGCPSFGGQRAMEHAGKKRGRSRSKEKDLAFALSSSSPSACFGRQNTGTLCAQRKAFLAFSGKSKCNSSYQEWRSGKHRRLTLQSSGQPPAGHIGVLRLFRLRRWPPLTSNVRRRNSKPCVEEWVSDTPSH